jgi:ribosomal protein S30
MREELWRVSLWRRQKNGLWECRAVEVTAGSATEAILKAREATPKYPASRRHEAEPRKTRDAWMKTVLRDVETWNNIPF